MTLQIMKLTDTQKHIERDEVAQKLYNALKVMTETSYIRKFLSEHDTMALKQAKEAISLYDAAQQ